MLLRRHILCIENLLLCLLYLEAPLLTKVSPDLFATEYLPSFFNLLILGFVSAKKVELISPPLSLSKYSLLNLIDIKTNSFSCDFIFGGKVPFSTALSIYEVDISYSSEAPIMDKK